MRRRKLTFGLYADEQGLARVLNLVEDAVRSRNARNTRIVGVTVARTDPGGEPSAADGYDFLAEQWAVEHPGQGSGARQPVELRLCLVCSRRTHRAIRRTVISTLCPEETAAHTCRVPWTAA
ncbi:hypothetical protein [Streptomyces avidinii]|uniref:Uncharacterized protein n=1 Tax=Streptomyces avidinii TaxID=1895 RepID=A0ABS4KZR6_STRAV|nr:hypothetical protein [Streptomyces avidinii]MBP2035523.1 hypothetical protein [Streptomyces avidinii]GGZ01887.1 hypothetical protein GCM10010343_29330 [Streptomyces avidinii]